MLADFRRFAHERSVPLDELGALADIFREARVVAIGESAHWIRDYGLARNQITRFLVERCGFTVFGLESGYSEGLAVDAWVRGGPGNVDDLAREHLTYRMGRCPELRDHLAWMRSSGRPLRYLGLDVPGSAASPLPALLSVRRWLADNGHTSEVAVADQILTLMKSYASEHALPAYAAYAAQPVADRDRTTALLTDLSVRLAVHRADRSVRHELRLAILLDQMLRGDVGARDLGMAETVLEMTRAGEKVVVSAANNHIQRIPLVGHGFEMSPLGHHLADRLGEAYVSIALTATSGTTTTRRPDPDAPGGVTVFGAPLAPPRDDGVESAFGDEPRALDLRAARGLMTGPATIRVMDGHQETDVLNAYDLVVSLPSITPSEY
jgi:erythromycin esterase